VFGALNVNKAFLRYLRATSGEKTISNFGSIGSWQGGIGYGLYNATKWAISGTLEAMHKELVPFNIKSPLSNLYMSERFSECWCPH